MRIFTPLLLMACGMALSLFPQQTLAQCEAGQTLSTYCPGQGEMNVVGIEVCPTAGMIVQATIAQGGFAFGGNTLTVYEGPSGSGTMGTPFGPPSGAGDFSGEQFTASTADLCILFVFNSIPGVPLTCQDNFPFPGAGVFQVCSESLPASTVTLSLDTDEVCETESSVTIGGGLPQGGTYSSAMPGVVTDDANGETFTFNATLAAGSPVTVTYTNGGTATDDIVVTSVNNASMNVSLTSHCITAGSLTLPGNGTPTGGVYSGDGIQDLGNGLNFVFNPAIAGAGTANITYTSPDACMSTAMDAIQVTDDCICQAGQSTHYYCHGNNETNVVAFEICPSAGMAIEATIQTGTYSTGDALNIYAGAPGSGTSGTLVVGSPFSGNLAGTMVASSVADQCLIFVSTTNNVGSCQDGIETILSACGTSVSPSVSLTNPGDFCSTDAPTTLGGGTPTGGTYSSATHPLAVMDDSNGETFSFDPAAVVPAGPITITYTVGGGSADQTFNVFAPGTASFTAPADLCVDADPVQLTTGSPAGGIYSGPGVSESGGDYFFNPGIAGLGTATISYTEPGGCMETVMDDVEVLAACGCPNGEQSFFYCTDGMDFSETAFEICPTDPTKSVQATVIQGSIGTFVPDDNLTVYSGASGSGATGTPVFGPFVGNLAGQVISGGNCPGECLSFVITMGPAPVGSCADGLESSLKVCAIDVASVDNDPPTAVCNDFTVNLPLSGMASVNSSDLAGGSSDTCPGTITFMPTSFNFDCTNVGDEVVTVTVFDASGNMADCMSTVTVQDNTPPTAVCQNTTVQLDNLGSGSITTADVDNGSSDNCGAVGLAVAPMTFDCDDVGTVSVTLTVTDSNGGSATCSATVTVEDNIAPVPTCVDATVQLNAAGVATVAPSAIHGGSAEACGFLPLSATPTAFTCANIGANTVVLTVSDVNGNSANCDATVTVEDNIAPTITCPGDETIGTDDGLCSAVYTIPLPTTDDNCSSDNIRHRVRPVDAAGNNIPGMGWSGYSMAATRTLDVGFWKIQWQVRDGNGNQKKCSFLVTVEDDEDPTIDDSADPICGETVNLTTPAGACEIEYAWTEPIFSDNCPFFFNQLILIPPAEGGNIQSTGPTSAIFPLGTNTLIHRLWDEAGNNTDCILTINVADDDPPVFTNCPDPIVLDNDAGVCGAFVSWAVPDFTDNCPGATSGSTADPGDFFPAGETTTVTYSGMDASGNQAEPCVFTVMINDTEDPVISCSGLTITVPNDPGECEADVDLPTPDGTDNCGVVTTEFRYREVDENNNALGPWSAWTDVSEASGTFAVGRYRIRWRIFDEAGNRDACTRFLTVEDVEPPVVECFNQTITFNGEETIALVIADLSTAEDNCGIASHTIDPGELLCEDLGQQIVVTTTAVDVNGLVSTCTSKVDIEGLPCGWSQQPDGVGCEDGSNVSYDVPNETFTVNSTDCFNPFSTNTDEYAFAQYNLCGNGEIIAQVTGISGTSFGWAGVMMRESNDPQAKSVALMTNLSANHRREARVVTGGTMFAQLMPSFGRHWLRIERFGSQFRAYSSFDGNFWFLRFAQTIPMEECVEVGLVVNGYFGNGELSATFANVSIEGSTFFEFQANEPAVEEAEVTKNFSVFPNPTAGQVTITLGDFLEQEIRLEVLDVNGQRVQLVREGILENSTEKLDLGQLPAGLYFVRLQLADGTVQTQRVVLQPRP